MKKLLRASSLFIIIAAFLWAIDGLFRVSLYTLPPAVVVFYEHAFGFAVLMLISFKWVKDLKKMTRKEWIAIAIVSLFSGALGTILYTAALQKVQFIPFSVVVLLQQQLQPIWAILAASILLHEKISKKFVLWSLVAFISVYFVTFKDLQVNFQTGSQTILAALFAIGAGFMWGTTTAVSKVVLNKVNFLSATALRFFFAPIFALFFVFGQGQQAAMYPLTMPQIQALLAITFSTGMVALAIYYYGLKKTPAHISAICEMTFPLTAILIDYFYFHKTLAVTQWLGALLLVFAMYKVTKLKTSK